jgi:predicted ester cyclase
MTTEENVAVVRRLLAAFNAADLTAVDAVVAPDFVDRTPLPGMQPGRAGLKQAIGAFHTAFADARWCAEQFVADRDTVVARLAFHGTHRGEILGVAPTGRAVTIAGIAIYRIVGGRVSKEWAVRDLFGLLGQLDAIPTTP